MLVKIERYYKYPDLRRQTPNASFKWKNFTFTEENVGECDYLVILEYPKRDFSINVNRNNIIHICQEPPNEVSNYRQYANKQVSVNYNQLNIKNNNILSHGALPWHIDKDYDFLNNLKTDDLQKDSKIVWVTSNQRSSKGHEKRMIFLDKIKKIPNINIFGRGINPIDDKWSVLSKSKYAIAYENFENGYYWTEKIIDCYLSYTMPIYFGCSNIESFFPKNSFIKIDPNDKHIDLFLKEVMLSNKWEENLDEIKKARELILNKYQLFPFLYDKINELDTIQKENSSSYKELVSFKGGNAYFDNYPFSILFKKNILKLVKKFN